MIEACVDTIESALAAASAGAGRLELCAGLVEGGTTPSSGLIDTVVERAGVPVFVLIRPRGGDPGTGRSGRSGAREIHVRCADRVDSAMRFRRPDVAFGRRYEPDDYFRTTTASERIRRVVAAVQILDREFA